eukprot:6734083-Pyramimonas_sp.AAC.1
MTKVVVNGVRLARRWRPSEQARRTSYSWRRPLPSELERSAPRCCCPRRPHCWRYGRWCAAACRRYLALGLPGVRIRTAPNPKTLKWSVVTRSSTSLRSLDPKRGTRVLVR